MSPTINPVMMPMSGTKSARWPKIANEIAITVKSKKTVAQKYGGLILSDLGRKEKRLNQIFHFENSSIRKLVGSTLRRYSLHVGQGGTVLVHPLIDSGNSGKSSTRTQKSTWTCGPFENPVLP